MRGGGGGKERETKRERRIPDPSALTRLLLSPRASTTAGLLIFLLIGSFACHSRVLLVLSAC